MFPTETQEDVFTGNSYEIVAWARYQRPVYFMEFGSYQGEWVLVAIDSEGAYHIYKDSYGSCSGCDSFQAQEPRTRAEGIKFAQDYQPFLVIPKETMRNVVAEGILGSLMPLNIQDDYGEVKMPEVVADVTAIAKLEEDLPITVDDIFGTTNQEVKRRLLEKFGYDEFVAEVGSEVIDSGDRYGKLIEARGLRFVHVRDASTPRQYLLPVPTSCKSARQAVAWTFGFNKADDYRPLIET